jgi:hypothetical protein
MDALSKGECLDITFQASDGLTGIEESLPQPTHSSMRQVSRQRGDKYTWRKLLG